MLYYSTINDLLKNSLKILMDSSVFENFRLVGGTALSLQLGLEKTVKMTTIFRFKMTTIFGAK